MIFRERFDSSPKSPERSDIASYLDLESFINIIKPLIAKAQPDEYDSGAEVEIDTVEDQDLYFLEFDSVFERLKKIKIVILDNVDGPLMTIDREGSDVIFRIYKRSIDNEVVNIKDETTGDQVPQEEIERFVYVQSLIHELVHLLSFQTALLVITPDGEYSQGYFGIQQSESFVGEEDPYSTPGTENFRQLNEGVTEIISQHIAEKYFNSTGDSALFRKLSHANDHIYDFERSVVNKLTEIIAQKYKVPLDTAWGAFVQAYFADPKGFIDSLRELSVDEPSVARLFNHADKTNLLDERFTILDAIAARVGRLE